MSDTLGCVFWDGQRLGNNERRGARRLGIDRRCLRGEPITDAGAHVCASADDAARIPYDDPSLQQARRDTMAWWIPPLGNRLVCLSTFSLDAVHCAGAVTVLRDPEPIAHDPFARLFRATLVRVDCFAEVPAPPGPVVERYAGAPWPAEGF